MIQRYTYKEIVWVDLEHPTQEEVLAIEKEFSLAPSVSQELLRPTIKPRVELYANAIYCILHFPARKHSHKENAQEIDFVIGKKFLITTHYDSIDPLHQFSKLFEVNSILDKSNLIEHGGYIFYYMIRELYKALDNELSVMNAELLEAEEKTFSGRERAMVAKLSHLSRNLLDFRRAVGNHGTILASFEAAGKKFFGDSFSYELRSIRTEFDKVDEELHTLHDFLLELRDTNDSLLSTQQNEIMKTLTIVAFIGVPLSILSSILQIDTVGRPIIGGPNDFLIIVFVEVIIALLLLLYFKYKRWL